MKLPQLTLRDLFWLVALVALGCGWWVDRSCLARTLDWTVRDAQVLACYCEPMFGDESMQGGRLQDIRSRYELPHRAFIHADWERTQEGQLLLKELRDTHEENDILRKAIAKAGLEIP